MLSSADSSGVRFANTWGIGHKLPHISFYTCYVVCVSAISGVIALAGSDAVNASRVCALLLLKHSDGTKLVQHKTLHRAGERMTISMAPESQHCVLGTCREIVKLHHQTRWGIHSAVLKSPD